MIPLWIYNLVIVLVVCGAVRWLSDRFRVVKIIFWSSAVIVSGLLFYLTRAQFLAWQQNGVSQYLVPPYATIDYFLQYALLHFWASYLVSFLAGVIFLKLAQYFNKKHGGKFFEKEEPYFIALSLFLAGQPGWILYLLLILTSTLLFALGRRLISGQIARVPYYNFWLPIAVAAILLNQLLINSWDFYKVLAFVSFASN